MKKGVKIFSLILVISVFFIFSDSHRNEANSKIILEDIKLNHEGGIYTVEIVLSQPVEYNCYFLEEPTGVVLDLFGSNIYVDPDFRFKDSLGEIDMIKIILYPDDSQKFKKVDLIFIQLKRQLKFSSKKIDSTVLVNLRAGRNNKEDEYVSGNFEVSSKSQSKFLTHLPESAQVDTEQVELSQFSSASSKDLQEVEVRNRLMPEVTVISFNCQILDQMGQRYVISGRFGWQDWLEIGIANHKPLQVTREQIELAQLRVREARRALLPAVTLKFTDTVAETLDVDLLQRSYGLQIAQPIMHGGELGFRVNQANVNLAIARKEHERIKADYTFDVKRAYYSLLLQGLNLAERKNILEETQDTLKSAREQYRLGLITGLEYLNIKSLYNETRFQYMATKRDLSLAELTFKQTLHITQDDLDINIQPFLAFDPVNINLERVRELALKRRPELAINSLILEFSDYNRRIAEARRRFRVDLSGFYGMFAEAYETEPLEPAEHWFVGLKVSKPFGASTITGSYTIEEKREVKTTLEQRLGTITYTVEISLLDRLDLLSERKSASIEYLRSLGELERIKELILAEIEEPYNTYRKALYQIHSLQKRMRFQEERIEVATLYWKVGRGTLSGVLEAKLRLADLKVAHNQALVNYYIGLSGLARGCNVRRYTYLIEPFGAIHLSEFACHEEKYAGKILELSELPEINLIGQVIAIGKNHDFVIINLGREDGIKEGMRFRVYRSGDKLGEIEVVSLKDSSSSCRIATSALRRDLFRLGDVVK